MTEHLINSYPEITERESQYGNEIFISLNGRYAYGVVKDQKLRCTLSTQQLGRPDAFSLLLEFATPFRNDWGFSV